MRSLSFSLTAQNDIRQIHHYIGQDNVPAAARMVRKIRETCDMLPRFPEMGRARDDLPTTRRLRSIGCHPYAIFYEIGEHIEIVRVIHMSMDISAEDWQ